MEYSNGVAEKLLNDRVDGLNYLEIERKHGIPAHEARAIVREALSEVTSKDPIEQRGILTLQIEKVIKYLITGLEAGSFKHGEAILKATERLAELHDLNQQTIKHEITVVSDEETAIILTVLRQTLNDVYTRFAELDLSTEVRKELSEAWPGWAAEASTASVENVIYAEIVE